MSDKTALYAVNVAPLLHDAALLKRAWETVMPQRQEKADRCRRVEDAALSLGAGLLLRYAFLKAGEPEPTGYITRNYGKPVGLAYDFSLSHSGEWALCAISNEDIGCDVEIINPKHTRVAARAFTADEQMFLAAAADEDERTRRFFRVWTLKESYQKATCCERHFDPSEFSVVPGALHAVPEAPAATCAEYDDLAGYACAACRLKGGELPPLTVVSMEELLKVEVEE